MFNKLKQVNDIRKQAKQIQNQLSDIMVVGESRGKNVMITIDGNQQVQGVKIEDSLDRADISDHVKQAFNDGSKKLQKELATKMQGMGGLDALKDMLG
jgi:DNA-binding protein YbaB